MSSPAPAVAAAIAAVQDPAVIRPILAHLARADAPDPPGPALIP